MWRYAFTNYNLLYDKLWYKIMPNYVVLTQLKKKEKNIESLAFL